MKIGFSNLKGGTGKTTLATNTAVALAHRGHSVCLVDTDTNRNSLQWYAARDESLTRLLTVGSTEHKALIKTVDTLNQQHDFVVMDGTPNLSNMAMTIILTADLLIIPVRPGGNDYRTLEEFMIWFEKAKAIRGGELLARFVINEYNDKIITFKGIKEHLKNTYSQIPTMVTVLKSRVAYVEAIIEGTSVIEGADLKAKAEIDALTDEILSLTSTHVKP